MDDYLEVNRILYGNAVQWAGNAYGNVQRQSASEVDERTRKRGSSNAQSTESESDTVELSEEALEKAGLKTRSDENKGNGGTQSLTAEEQAQVEKLKKADSEVRAHEQAHMAAGGNLVTRGASYEYQTGPDGNRYAVGGEVQIDTSPEKNPEDTKNKMDRVRQAALAPANPSAQDRMVATQAAAAASKATAEIMQQKQEELSGNSSNGITQAANIQDADQLRTNPARQTSGTGLFIADRQRVNSAHLAYTGTAWQSPQLSTSGLMIFA